MGGFTFAGEHCSVYHLRLMKSPVSLLPATRDRVIVLPGRHGALRMIPDLGERTLSLVCWLESRSVSELHTRFERLRAWLNPLRGEQRLIFDRVPGRYYLAVYAGGGLDAEVTGKQGLFTLEMVCPDPFSYAAEEKQVAFSADSAVVNNAGTHEALPVFAVSFTAAASEWKVVLGARYLRVVHGFNFGDTLDVDSATGKVLINGLTALDKLDWQNSEFFALPPGQSTLCIMPAGVCTATVRFRERWL